MLKLSRWERNNLKIIWLKYIIEVKIKVNEEGKERSTGKGTSDKHDEACLMRGFQSIRITTPFPMPVI